jgi:predicted histone-like DNA-binding protein
MINLIPKEITSNDPVKGEIKKYYLEMHQAEPLEFESLCQLIADRSGVSPFTVEMVVNEIADVMIENAKIGRGIRIGNLGTILPAVTSQKTDKEEDLDISKIKRIRVLFKPSLRIKKAMKNMRMRVKRDYYAKYKAEKENQQMENESIEEQEN